MSDECERHGYPGHCPKCDGDKDGCDSHVECLMKRMEEAQKQLQEELDAERELTDKLVAAVRFYFAKTDTCFDPIVEALQAIAEARKL